MTFFLFRIFLKVDLCDFEMNLTLTLTLTFDLDLDLDLDPTSKCGFLVDFQTKLDLDL